MTHRLALAFSLALVAAGCSSSTTPTPAAPAAPAAPKFTATLLPSNEVPAVTNADAPASGTVTMTMNNTKDAAGNITASTADFQVVLTGFPAGTTLTGAHIHPGAAGTNGGVIWSLALGTGEIVLANGATTFSKTAITPADVATAQAILNNPAGFYFNVHTTISTGGAVRGQLVRAN
jgi:hypothetical protein